MKKGIKALLTAVCAVIAAALVLFGAYKLWFDPYRGTFSGGEPTLGLDTVLSREQAREDVDRVMKMLRSRHPAWLEKDNARAAATEERYLAETELIDASEDGVTVLEEWRAVSRILHELGDGHTQVWASPAATLYLDDFGLLRQYGVPVKINGEPTEDVFGRFCELYQYETEEYARAIFEANVLISKTYLTWIGVDTTDGVVFTYEAASGELDREHKFVTLKNVSGRAASGSGEPWSYRIDADKGVGVFALRSCDYNSEYRAAVGAFFKQTNAAGCDSIIVDLRSNGGGSSLCADEFIRYLDADGYYGWPSHVRIGNILIKNKKGFTRNKKLGAGFSGDLYVLTDTRTFSAAMDFAMLIEDNGLGTLIGEAPGNLPDSYGDTLSFTAPNSGLRFSVSYKRWFRIDETKAGRPIEPDVPCACAEAMDKAYELIEAKRAAIG
ncbi:MAG: hypothetical protein IK101_05970 [Oscillospiraceae bacterium]|nr:hypothetical protein [Oscillospiraceae bacterium]